MPRDYRQQIEDMLAAISKIKAYVAGMSYEDFAADGKTEDAVIRNLEIIGEAARSLPEDVTAAAETVEWRKIIGLRNVLIHAYFGVSIPIIWDVVTNKLDDLETACRTIQDELGRSR